MPRSYEVSTTVAVAGRSPDFRFSIFDFRLPIGFIAAPIENRQLTIGNHETHPLSRGGTDLMSLRITHRAVM